MAGAIVIGLAGGALIGYLGARAIYRVLSRRSSHPRIVAALITAGYITAIPLSFFSSFVIGGNLGGGWGEFISMSVNLGSVGVPLGLAIGIAVVLGAGLTVGAAAGGLIGYGIALALKGKLAA